LSNPMIDKEKYRHANEEAGAAQWGSGRVLIRVKDLHKSFDGQVVLDGVNLKLLEGEVVLLRGENGSGKTTLLNILTGNLEPDSGEIALSVNARPECFSFPRRWWQEINPWDHFTPERVAVENVGRTWQDIRLFSSQTLLDNLNVANPAQTGERPGRALIQRRRWRDEERRNRTKASGLLRSLGLADRDESSADMISLGQSKRVSVARAVSAGGKVLFLDEPLAGLDNEGAALMQRYMSDFAKEHGVTMVIVEHVWNAHHILGVATAVWTLRDGKVVVEPLDPAHRKMVEDEQGVSSEYLRRFVSCMHRVAFEELPRGASLSFYRIAAGPASGERLLEVADLVVSRGHRPVIGDDGYLSGVRTKLAFSLREGELAILQAPNGWGKTTLYEALAGIIPVSDGLVRLLGRDITGSPIWERARAGLCLLRADCRAFPSLTVEETFALSDRSAVPAALEPLRGQELRQLSGGERQVINMDLVKAMRRHVYLLDEPFSALDVRHIAETFEAISELISRPQTAVLLAVPVAAGARKA
jgi:ABC-type branched-subunit amino acid transport system ATPase component